jgi:branched-chain amino acid transport system ATP-binding protein
MAQQYIFTMKELRKIVPPKREILKGIYLSFFPGAKIGVIGGNGAGKSTLMKAISGLEPAAGGEIRFDGADITRLPPHQRVPLGVAQSPEGRQVFPDQTVRDNLMLGAYHRDATAADIEREIEAQFAAFPRLRERQDQLAGTMSGGEQQMLAMARALMSKPKLLLLDEPSLGLAPLIVRDIFGVIKEVKARGVTILLVEQMAIQALGVADRAYVLETGRITMEGTGKELLANPKIKEAYLGKSH